MYNNDWPCGSNSEDEVNSVTSWDNNNKKCSSSASISNKVRGPFRRQANIYNVGGLALENGSATNGYSSSTEPISYNKYWLSTAEDEDAVCNDNNETGVAGDKTPTPYDSLHKSRSPIPTDGGDDIFGRSKPELFRTPSLVDELLSEIYARFGDGLSSRNLDSSRRASASGSQVYYLYRQMY